MSSSELSVGVGVENTLADARPVEDPYDACLVPVPDEAGNLPFGTCIDVGLLAFTDSDGFAEDDSAISLLLFGSKVRPSFFRDNLLLGVDGTDVSIPDPELDTVRRFSELFSYLSAAGAGDGGDPDPRAPPGRKNQPDLALVLLLVEATAAGGIDVLGGRGVPSCS